LRAPVASLALSYAALKLLPFLGPAPRRSAFRKNRRLPRGEMKARSYKAGSCVTPLAVTFWLMSASEIIGEIQRLSPSEQMKIIQFAYRLDAERMLSGKELAALARRMIDATDPAEKLRIREELTRGFYGGKADA
jgi:hypothetical protein